MWTKWHFYTIPLTFVVLIVLALLIARLLRGKSEKIRRLPFQILAVGLLALEVVKQIYNIEPEGYNTYALPFHYCSLFLYAYPLHAFYKGRYKQTANTVAFCCGASLFFFMLVMPSVVYSENNIKYYFDNYDNFHTVTFHSYACFYFFLMVAMGAYELQTKRDLKVVAWFFGSYVVVATAMSYLFKENFHNLLRSNLGAAESVRLAVVESLGWVGQALYTVIMFTLTIVFAMVAYFAVKGLLVLVDKRKKKVKEQN